MGRYPNDLEKVQEDKGQKQNAKSTAPRFRGGRDHHLLGGIRKAFLAKVMFEASLVGWIDFHMQP